MDKNGYFLLYVFKMVFNYVIRNCWVYLVKFLDVKCSKVLKFYGGYLGFFLKLVVKFENVMIIFNKFKYSFFNVGLFVFEFVCFKWVGFI